MAGCGCGGKVGQLQHYEWPPSPICLQDLSFNLDAVTSELPLNWCHLIQTLRVKVCADEQISIMKIKDSYLKIEDI